MDVPRPPESQSLFVDWEQQARATVESLRLEAGNDPPADRATAELIADLRNNSPEFARWWDEHRVYQRTHGSKALRHSLVGDLIVEYETLTLPGDPPHTTLFVYTTEPRSPVQPGPRTAGELVTGVHQRLSAPAT